MSVNLVFLTLLFAGCLVPDLAAQSDASRKWVCTGETTNYTDSDCEQQGAVNKTAVDGCFHVPGLSQYKSCGLTCNDALVGSVKEARCKTDCFAYWKNCSETIVQPPTEPLTEPPTETTTVKATQAAVGVIVGSVIGGVVGVVGLIGLIIGVRCCYKKKICCLNKDTDEKSTKTDNRTPPPGSGLESSGTGNSTAAPESAPTELENPFRGTQNEDGGQDSEHGYVGAALLQMPVEQGGVHGTAK